ncbi:MAG: hypothetical protein RBT59_11690 [Arcobacteraceae bacterium]|jgi:hypothetical protein|nr:hypothetical protein [Arcobacteraceae bacterium]
MDYKIDIVEGKEYIDILNIILEKCKHKVEVIQKLKDANINQNSNAFIRFKLLNLELVLGCGHNPFSKIYSQIEYIEPSKQFLKILKEISLKEDYISIEILDFIDNRCRSSHENSFVDIDITINLSKLYLDLANLQIKNRMIEA